MTEKSPSLSKALSVMKAEPVVSGSFPFLRLILLPLQAGNSYCSQQELCMERKSDNDAQGIPAPN